MAPIISIGSKGWLILLNPFDIRVMECVRKAILKLVNEYFNTEILESDFNSKMLNAIANGVDINQHDLISTCTTRKLGTFFVILIKEII